MPRLEDLLELLEDDPDDYLLHHGLGMEYMRAEMFTEAVGAFERTIQLQPDYSVAYRELGRCLVRLDQREQAREIWVKGREVAVRKSDLQVIQDIEQLLRDLTPRLPSQ